MSEKILNLYQSKILIRCIDSVWYLASKLYCVGRWLTRKEHYDKDGGALPHCIRATNKHSFPQNCASFAWTSVRAWPVPRIGTSLLAHATVTSADYEKGQRVSVREKVLFCLQFSFFWRTWSCLNLRRFPNSDSESYKIAFSGQQYQPLAFD